MSELYIAFLHIWTYSSDPFNLLQHPMMSGLYSTFRQHFQSFRQGTTSASGSSFSKTESGPSFEEVTTKLWPSRNFERPSAPDTEPNLRIWKKWGKNENIVAKHCEIERFGILFSGITTFWRNTMKSVQFLRLWRPKRESAWCFTFNSSPASGRIYIYSIAGTNPAYIQYLNRSACIRTGCGFSQTKRVSLTREPQKINTWYRTNNWGYLNLEEF